MKTKNLLIIAVVLLVSLLSNAQNPYTMTPNANTIAVSVTMQIAQTNSIVINKGVPPNYTIKFYSYTTASYTTPINVLPFATPNATVPVNSDFTIYTNATASTATIVIHNTNINHMYFTCLNPSNQPVWFWDFVETGTATGIANIAKVQNMGLNVYPNPSVDKVNISLNFGDVDKKVKIFLYSITGQLVFEDEFTTNALTVRELNVDNYARGTYILQVKEGDNVQTSKLILQ